MVIQDAESNVLEAKQILHKTMFLDTEALHNEYALCQTYVDDETTIKLDVIYNSIMSFHFQAYFKTRMFTRNLSSGITVEHSPCSQLHVYIHSTHSKSAKEKTLSIHTILLNMISKVGLVSTLDYLLLYHDNHAHLHDLPSTMHSSRISHIAIISMDTP